MDCNYTCKYFYLEENKNLFKCKNTYRQSRSLSVKYLPTKMKNEKRMLKKFRTYNQAGNLHFIQKLKAKENYFKKSNFP